MDAQTHLKQKVLQLERSSDTRWLYWYRAVNKIKLRYEAILATLDATAQSHRDGSAEALGLKTHMERFSFIMQLHAIEKILGVTYTLSEQLQERGIAINKATGLIRSVKQQLERNRSQSEWESTVKNAKAFAATVDVPVDHVDAGSTPLARPRRVRTVSKLLAGFVTEASSGQREPEDDDMHRRLYFEIIDRFISEFTRRFTQNEALLQSIEAFDSSSPKFLDADMIDDFASLYDIHVDRTLLPSQCYSAQGYLTQKDGSILSALEKLDALKTGFSEIRKLFRIAATLPVTTASNERFFSVLKRVKDYLRTTMGDERLTHLMLMAVEPVLVKSLNLDDLVTDFAKLRPRRFPLMD